MQLVPPIEKPVHIVGVLHEKEGVSDLQVLHETIRLLLDSNPIGKVCVFLENSTGTEEASKFINTQVRAGKLPSEANALYLFQKENHRLPIQEDNFEEWPARLQKWHEENNPFIAQQYAVLNSIAEDYPNRLSLVMEAKPEEDVMHSQHLVQKADTNYNRALILAQTSGISAGVSAYQKFIENFASLNQDRERNIIKQLKDELNNPDIIGCVVMMGAAHTTLGYKLKAEGHAQTTFVIPERRPSFEPSTEAVRRFMLDPARQTSEYELKVSLAQEIIFTSLFAPIQQGQRPDTTEQSLLEQIWKATKVFDQDMNALQAFEEDMIKNGAFIASEKVIKKNETLPKKRWMWHKPFSRQKK